MSALQTDLLLRQGFIDGQWVDADSGATFAVVNPATQAVVASTPMTGRCAPPSCGTTRRPPRTA